MIMVRLTVIQVLGETYIKPFSVRCGYARYGLYQLYNYAASK